VTVDVFGEACWRPVNRDAVLVDQFIVGGIGARKADHAPRHHVAIAAVNRVAEESLQSALLMVRKEHVGGHAPEILLSGLKMPEVRVLLL
jgi:hypothetical protein